MANLIRNGLLFAAALSISLVLSEIVVRQFLHPVDFLLPQTVNDPMLGHRILPNTGGHDEWGFRNYNIESEVEIVAIGDSQTYGVSATFQESWPAHLSNLRNARVYNLALGGYGPLQYLHLLESKALELNPEIVVIGLYLGNDLVDSYRLVYSNQSWADYKSPTFQDTQSEKTEVTTNWKEKRFLNGIRNWLAQHSVLYRFVTQTIIGDLVRESEFRSNASNVIELQHMNTHQLFMADDQFSALDMESQRVQEGVRISKAALKKIKQICLTNKIKLLVAMIPTKELVYSELLREQYTSKLPTSLAQLFRNEYEIRDQFMQMFKIENIAFVDTLPALKKAASQGKDIYPMNDGHTNGNGYLIIAEEINSVL